MASSRVGSWIARFAVACTLVVATAAVAADAFPNKPVRVVVPFGAGSGNDVIVRGILPEIAAALGVPVVVENKPGANSIIGADYVAHGVEPDGYTIMFTNSTTHHQNAWLYKDLPYSAADFVPVSQVVGDAGIVMTVNSKLPVKNVQEFIAYAKAHPGEIFYGSPGEGSTHHIYAQLLAKKYGLQMTHVPYKNGAEYERDLVIGTLQMAFMGPTAAANYEAQGRLRVIASTGERRRPNLPNVPTFREQGIPGFEATASLGFFAPAKIPPGALSTLASAIAKALKQQSARDRLSGQGLFPTSTDAAEAARIFKEEAVKWKTVILDSGVTLN